jgi:putative acetyltransferase
MRIRDETPGDLEAMARVAKAAFRDNVFSPQTEGFILAALRRAGALTLSLVAEDRGRVVGQAAFSPVETSDGSGGWYGAGPVSVAPRRQGQGIGSALMREGLSRLQALGAAGCLLVGDPCFYDRFGFAPCATLTLEGPPPEIFLARSFTGRFPTGAVTFHPGFNATGE